MITHTLNPLVSNVGNFKSSPSMFYVRLIIYDLLLIWPKTTKIEVMKEKKKLKQKKNKPSYIHFLHNIIFFPCD